jgi:hemerythrin-like metal-binding protein
LLTGFKGMDEDHKVWIGLANEVLAASHPQVARADLRNALDKLALYSNDHFLRENTAMKDSDYPFTRVHMAAHATMMKTIIEFRQRLYSNTYLDLKELQDFILTWLPRHIIHIDKGLAQVLSHQR